MKVGDKIGKLTILDKIKINKSGKPKFYFHCLCDCGNKTDIRTDTIEKSKFASCGCEKINNRIKTILGSDKGHDGIKNIGNVYGELTLIKLTTFSGHVKYDCKCICGRIVNVRFDHLKNGETKSCGCKKKEYLKEASSLFYGESSFNSLYRSYKNGAKTRGIYFELEKEQFKELTKSNCYYCGCSPSQVCKADGGNGDYTYNGIDRIDNDRGYLVDNCNTCCKTCNYMKKQMGLEDFKTHIVKLYNNISNWRI